MMKQLIALLLALFIMSVSWSQEADEVDETEAAAAEVTTAAEEEPDEDDAELDEQGYALEEEEDDFIPSEEVSADQSLSFPVDI